MAKPVTASEYPLVESIEEPVMSARAYVIYDKNARVIVDGMNEHMRFAPASTVKIMTALVGLEHYNLTDILEAHELWRVEGSKMNLYEGERISFINLLYGLMLPSGNDAAYTIAYNYPGGIDAFVTRMNQKAEELLLENTKFYDVSGYDDRNYSTAYDLMRLGVEAVEHPVLSGVIRTKSILVFDESYRVAHELSNLNKLLENDKVIGVKTGFTNEAAGVLVTSIVHNNTIYVISVLKSQDRFFDTEQVIDKIISRIEYLSY